jgi:hypothetical protein
MDRVFLLKVPKVSKMRDLNKVQLGAALARLAEHLRARSSQVHFPSQPKIVVYTNGGRCTFKISRGHNVLQV